jgi:hypothetical protein
MPNTEFLFSPFRRILSMYVREQLVEEQSFDSICYQTNSKLNGAEAYVG